MWWCPVNGWCGTRCCLSAKGLGANVIVTEMDPIRALEALMDGNRVMPMAEAPRIGDIFITVTGNKDVLRREHFEMMESGSLISNAGRFNVDIDILALYKLATRSTEPRDFVKEYCLKNGGRIGLLGDGRLVNLAATAGHPAEVIEISFRNHALSVEYIKDSYMELEKRSIPYRRPSMAKSRV